MKGFFSNLVDLRAAMAVTMNVINLLTAMASEEVKIFDNLRRTKIENCKARSDKEAAIRNDSAMSDSVA